MTEWAQVREAFRERIKREGDDWLGVNVDGTPVVIALRGELIEVLAGVSRNVQALTHMLARARQLPCGGLVLERGAYMVKEIVPLAVAAVALEPAVARMARAATELRTLARPGESTIDLFANYLR